MGKEWHRTVRKAFKSAIQFEMGTFTTFTLFIASALKTEKKPNK